MKTPSALLCSVVLLLALLVPPKVMAQTDMPPILHGKYLPVGHAGETYTFYNSGKFELYADASCLKGEGEAKGTYVIKEGMLRLTFTSGKWDGDRLKGLGMKFPITVLTQDGAEVVRFRLEPKEPLNHEQIWERTTEIIPLQEQ